MIIFYGYFQIKDSFVRRALAFFSPKRFELIFDLLGRVSKITVLSHKKSTVFLGEITIKALQRKTRIGVHLLCQGMH